MKLERLPTISPCNPSCQHGALYLGQVPVSHDQPEIGLADAAQQVRIARWDRVPLGFPKDVELRARGPQMQRDQRQQRLVVLPRCKALTVPIPIEALGREVE